jgi:predicted  nucleic acid-binding Zn-ribbon protein
MSEERFDRLENQLTQVIQSIATMQQHISGIEQKVSGIEQKVSGIEQNVNAAREDITSLRNRIDSVEGAVSVVIRSTFTAHQNFVDDLNFDLLKNERETRRLSRRVSRLERLDIDD